RQWENDVQKLVDQTVKDFVDRLAQLDKVVARRCSQQERLALIEPLSSRITLAIIRGDRAGKPITIRSATRRQSRVAFCCEAHWSCGLDWCDCAGIAREGPVKFRFSGN